MFLHKVAFSVSVGKSRFLPTCSDYWLISILILRHIVGAGLYLDRLVAGTVTLNFDA